MSSGECQCAHWVRGVTAWPLTSVVDGIKPEVPSISPCDSLLLESLNLSVGEIQSVLRPLQKIKDEAVLGGWRLAAAGPEKLLASHRTLSFHPDLSLHSNSEV